MSETLDNNRLIAEFMGGSECVTDREFWILPSPPEIGFKKPSEFEYHSDWNWLMFVVEKIESIHDDFHGYFAVYIGSNSCTIQGTNLRTDEEYFHPAYYNNVVLDTKISSSYYAVVEFIKWYRTNFK